MSDARTDFFADGADSTAAADQDARTAFFTSHADQSADTESTASTVPRASVVGRNPRMGAINTPNASASDVTQAAASGVNASVADLAGIPMDAATNASNLAKSAVESAWLKFGGTPPRWLDPDKPENVPGTSEWIKRKTREAGGANLIDTAPNASGQDLSALHTAGETLGPLPLAAAAGGAADAAMPPRTAPVAPTAQDALNAQAMNSPQSMGAAAAAPNVQRASPQLQQAIVRGAQSNGGALNPYAVARHMDADALPVPIQLTEGQALQDPTLISNEQNMRGKHPELAARFDEQNKALAQNVTALRDRVGPDVFSANPIEHGDTLIQSYKDKAAAADADISAKYQALRDANGGQFPVSAPKLLQNVTKQLNDQLLVDHAPKAVMSTLGKLADDDNMTFQNFEALRTNLARTMRSATDGNERAAAGVIRSAMEELPLAPGAANLKPLADTARSAARSQFQALEADPAYKAAVNETVPPDRFVQKFVTGPSATRDGVAQIRENLAHDPVATQTLGVATLDHLKKAAGLNEAGEGNFTQAGFNKNLEALGPRLQSLVDPKTAEDLSTLGTVAKHTQFQPRGSSVNNSNTFVAAAAEHAKSAAEGGVNVAFKGVPVGSWVRGHFQASAEKRAVQRMLEPGAGITRLQSPP